MRERKKGNYRRPTEKALKNLKHIKKGQVLNPRGAQAHNPAMRALKKLTIDTYREVIEIAMTGNIARLTELIDDPKTSAVQVGVARCFRKAVTEGDWNLIEQIAARIVGKLPDKFEIAGNSGPQITITLPSNGREVVVPPLSATAEEKKASEL